MSQEQNNQLSQRIDESVKVIKEKMKLINFNNFQPPYFLNTLTKFRETYLSRFIKDIKIDCNSETNQQLRSKLRILHLLVQKFDDDCFDIYASQLVQPYIRKMYQDNYEFDNIKFKEVFQQYHLNAEIQQTLNQAAQWLTQIQITQDLLSRIQLYFKIKVPHIIEKIRCQGLKSQKLSWSDTFISGVKQLITFGLRKGSKVIQSTVMSTVAPGALMLTLAVVSGTIKLPWKNSINPKNVMTAAAVAAVPFILETLAESVEKSDYQSKLKIWAQTFSQLSESIRLFNEVLEQSMRNCLLSSTIKQFQIQRTNLEKIMNELNKKLDCVTNFDIQKIEEMKQRTEAYYKQYEEIKQGEWTLVVEKAGENRRKKKEDQYTIL